MRELEAHDRELVLGITGSGKSTYVCEDLVKDAPRVCAWDPHAEYPLEEVTLDELEQRPELLHTPRVRLSVVHDHDDLDELSAGFCRWVLLMKAEAENLLLVVDEVAILEGKAVSRLNYLATQSRHWGCPLVMIAQRAATIPKTAREQCSRITSFLQTDPEDIDVLRKRIGAEKADRIAKLPRYESVVWDQSEVFKEAGASKESAA